ncbi:uncharacterized protein [Palaemon carinicauda]|uniref:uncharacterized protein n=1 Tax=Palaemon carinicauda TaxID=392227 RepID=UPI0035B61C7E
MFIFISQLSPHPYQFQQEEEESWISGEELYTEGSSDDETSSQGHCKSPAHHHHQHHSPKPPLHLPLADKPKKVGPLPSTSPKSPPLSTSEPAAQDDPHLTETTRRLSLMGVEEAAAVKVSARATDEQVEEQEDVMLWRPKRGSIKLPHIELDPPSTPLQQVSG